MVEVTVELTKQEEHEVCTNSIERVMNNAIKCAMQMIVETDGLNEQLNEDLWTLANDCEALKAINSKIWDATREGIFKKNS